MSELNRESTFWILLNQGSGNDNKEKTQETIARVFESRGQRFQFVCVEEPDQLLDEARAAVLRIGKEGGALVVAGGDGSISCVAPLALAAQCPFGVIPLGTFNYFARANGISEEPEKAAQNLLDAMIEPVQVGKLNGEVFLVNASVGLYPELLEEREQYKSRFGRSRVVALAAAFATLLREHRQLSLELVHDDTTERVVTPTLVVGNNRLQLEQIGVGGREVTRGKLMAIILKANGPQNLIRLLFSAAAGRIAEESEVVTYAIHTLIVRPAKRYGRRSLKIAMDGEIRRMKTPLKFEVAEKRLQLIKGRPAAENSQ